MKKYVRGLFLIACAITGVSCGGGYQAPVSEQGEQQVNRAPIIVQSGNNSGQVITERSRASDAPASQRQGNTSVQSRAPNGSRVTQNAANSAVATGSRSTSVPNSHTVREGDTLYSIAYQYDLDFRMLAIANNLRAPYTIFVGNRINLSVSGTASTTGSSAINSTLGTPVSDNSVARSQGGSSRSSAVLRQPISRASTTAPTWDWPHRGRVLRGFGQGESKGLDISGSLGEPVLAAGAGDVVYSGRGIQGAGNLIILRHSDRYLSAYAHNQTMLVGEGDRVSMGQTIAEMGANSANDPLLHFEIRLDGKSIDPVRLLPSK